MPTAEKESTAYYKEQLNSIKQMFSMTTKHLQEVQDELKEKNNNISQSVAYAQKIQSQMLPTFAPKVFQETYGIVKQRDLIGGDFIYYSTLKDKVIFGLMDCTGHGVPGALLSMMGYNFINDSVHSKQILNPAELLKEIDRKFHHYFSHHADEKVMRDGMDGIMCVYNQQTNTLHYSMAGRPFWSKQNGRWEKHRPDRNSIGGAFSSAFVEHEVKCDETTEVFLFSDGLSDQFGGENDKKFLTKRIMQHLKKHDKLRVQEKAKKLNQTIEEWMGDNKQTDDIAYLLIKI
jgi:serine phosphatase RsbU (regulator of sigma subunit)